MGLMDVRRRGGRGENEFCRGERMQMLVYTHFVADAGRCTWKRKGHDDDVSPIIKGQVNTPHELN